MINLTCCIVFALFGVMTLVGNLCASHAVRRWGAFTTSAVFMACVAVFQRCRVVAPLWPNHFQKQTKSTTYACNQFSRAALSWTQLQAKNF
jgi:predicted MFS family arabinose efflux permease